MLNTRKILASITATTLLISASRLSAYEIDVHEKICEVAVKRSITNTVFINLGYSTGIEAPVNHRTTENQVTKKTILTWITEGGKSEDEGKNGQNDFLGL